MSTDIESKPEILMADHIDRRQADELMLAYAALNLDVDLRSDGDVFRALVLDKSQRLALVQQELIDYKKSFKHPETVAPRGLSDEVFEGHPATKIGITRVEALKAAGPIHMIAEPAINQLITPPPSTSSPS